MGHGHFGIVASPKGSRPSVGMEEGNAKAP